MRVGAFLGAAIACLLTAAPAWSFDDVFASSKTAETYEVERAPATARIRVTGRLIINFNLVASPPVHNGEYVRLGASISVTDATYKNLSERGGNTQVSGRNVSGTLQFPYTFQVASTAVKINVRVSATVDLGDWGAQYYQYNVTTYLTRIISLPPNGTTTVLNFVGSL